MMAAKAIIHEGKWKVQVNLEGKSRIVPKTRDFIRNPEFDDEMVAKCLAAHINTVAEHCLATGIPFPWERFFPQDKRQYKFRLVALDWLSLDLKPATVYQRTRIMQKYIFPHVGENDVRELHRADFHWIKKEYGDTAKAKNIKQVVQTFLNWTYDEEIRREHIKLPPIKIKTKALVYVSKEDREKIQANVESDYQNATLLSLRMGLRSNEIAALEWDQVLWGSGINVSRGMSNYAVGLPKEGKSRFSPFQGEVEPVLRGMYEDIMAQGTIPAGRVFLLPSGAQIWPNILSHAWTVAARGLGIKSTMHTNRHSMAQDMLEEGANMGEVSAILGHMNVRTTEKFYGRHNRGSLIKIAERRKGVISRP